jgi:hypothetical protein
MKRLFLLLLCLCAAWMTLPVLAQDGNLLADPGMEGEYTNRGRADLNVPAPWGLSIIEQPRTADWMNLQPVAFPHNGPGPDPHGGAKALNFNRGYATFTTVIYQTVPFAQGTNVTASAWAQLKTCNIPADSDNCTSNGESGAYVRVGIDPNGGNNPFDGDIVWSFNASPHGVWSQVSTTATTTGPTATIFLYVTQTNPTQLNNVYWDDAYFGAGGAGGSAAAVPGQAAAPPPTPVPQFVPFVVPQNQRPDGSIIHIVGAGDTLDSIAVAYGMTRADILALNADIRDVGYLLLGQEIIIQAPARIGGFGNEPSIETTAEAGGAIIPPAPTTAPTMTPGGASGSRLFYYFFPQFDPAQRGSALPGVAIASAETPASFSSAPADATTTASSFTAVDSAGAVVPEITPTGGQPPVRSATPRASVTPANRETETSAPGATADSTAQATATGLRAPGIDPNAPPAPVNPTATARIDPLAALARICVSMFTDFNLNRIQEAGETALSGGVIVIAHVSGETRTIVTDGGAHCFDDVTPGDYIARASAPDGYGLTTPAQFSVRAEAGIPVDVMFGAAVGVEVVQAPTPDAVVTPTITETRTPTSPIIDNLGVIVVGAAGVVLVIGIGVTLMLRRR